MKRFFLCLLAALMLLSVVPTTPQTVSAESISIRKVVSVVYDDSGSMKGDKWAYANYAMQAFCGMLNSEDQLYLTYMSRAGQSNYTPEKVDLTAGGIQKSIDTIRNHTENATTPFYAVQKAFDKLKSVQDSNKTTQYWLVVITDGEFDECNYQTRDYKVNYLNEHLTEFTNTVMPNGTKPQVTFMAIGDDLVSPTENEYQGIYLYEAKTAAEITATMSSMADRISSRTRLDKTAVKVTDGKTIEISSTIPLLNIAVLSQDSGTTVSKALDGKNKAIPISRSANLSYPNYLDLVGSAYLIGDSQKVIGAGTYKIVFDQIVDVNDVVILLEPALETRIVATVGEQEITDFRDLENIPAGEKVSVTCKVYELGTDKEIKDSSLPKGTTFTVAVAEDGEPVDEVVGKTMDGYSLKNSDTEIVGAVNIPGFNPISYSAKFKPGQKVNYTLTSSYGGKVKNVHLNSIANNTDLSVCFTISANGKEITDPAVTKTFKPTITTSPQGNDGELSYSDDGKIVFTPKTSSPLTKEDDNLDVTVTCTLENGTKASEIYTVVVAEYAVVPVASDVSIRKTEFFQNDKSISFYITKDGNRLTKAQVEGRVSAAFDEDFAHLSAKIEVADDGMVTVTPYAEEERKITFGNWWTNWFYYFRQPGHDLTVTLMHSYVSGDGTLNVIGAPVRYQLLYVYLPLFIELLMLAIIIAYIVRYFTKARFAPNAALYVGTIDRNRRLAGTHFIELSTVPLNQYNTFANLWNPFKELTVDVGGVPITAALGGRIICQAPFPWYSDNVRPKARTVLVSSPQDIVDYCMDKGEMVIQEIKPTTVMDEQNRYITQEDSVYYFVNAEVSYAQRGYQQTEVIESAVAFCYSTIHN